MEVKIISKTFQLTLETTVGEFIFETVWNPGVPFEVICKQRPTNDSTISKKQLKELLTAFKEAENKLTKEIETLENLFVPCLEYINNLVDNDKA